MIKINEIVQAAAEKLRTAKVQDQVANYFESQKGYKTASRPTPTKVMAALVEIGNDLDRICKTSSPIDEALRKLILEGLAEEVEVSLDDLRRSTKAGSVDALSRMTVTVEQLFRDIKDKKDEKK